MQVRRRRLSARDSGLGVETGRAGSRGSPEEPAPRPGPPGRASDGRAGETQRPGGSALKAGKGPRPAPSYAAFPRPASVPEVRRPAGPGQAGSPRRPGGSPRPGPRLLCGPWGWEPTRGGPRSLGDGPGPEGETSPSPYGGGRRYPDKHKRPEGFRARPCVGGVWPAGALRAANCLSWVLGWSRRGRRAGASSEPGRGTFSHRRGPATLTYDTLRFAEFEDFPETTEPVWILGRKYTIFTEKEEILSDVTSRLWFTYRKNFPAIGGTGPTSDTGWGCMLRCGQMIFAQALVCRHLGRDWRWKQGRRQADNYFNVLNAFIDKKDSYYSIHQIAQMGVGEGKSIGQWYGPNTVAQVLKKLAVFDTWSSLAVHIAMDNTVVMEEIRRLCKAGFPRADGAAFPADSELLSNGYPPAAEVTDRASPWRPLVLLIPLRLGLTDINEAYTETLKHCFMMPQSLGVIGGKPNSAHYFIGYVGEELIYLDPHTTQPAVEATEGGIFPDETFHCQHPPCRMNIGELDPSIAVGFFCKTEEDFNDWCQQVKKLSRIPGALPMFELVERQPSHFSCPDVLNLSLDSSDVERLERFFDSEDEDFEILSL